GFFSRVACEALATNEQRRRREQPRVPDRRRGFVIGGERDGRRGGLDPRGRDLRKGKERGSVGHGELAHGVVGHVDGFFVRRFRRRQWLRRTAGHGARRRDRDEE